MKRIHPLTVQQELQDAYLRYVDTTYWLRSQELRDERRELLKKANLLFTEPHLEPIPQYDTTVDLIKWCESKGIDIASASLVGEALFRQFTPEPDRIMVRDHQAAALAANFRSGIEDGRNAVITSGTGSGKTESFLLPVLTRIVAESLRDEWTAVENPHRWWDSKSEKGWKGVRSSSSRQSAVRTLVLYPTNALVEDQIVRLRRAVGQISLGGAGQIWFGRFTGSTPGSIKLDKNGNPANWGQRFQGLARMLKDMCSEFDELKTNGVKDSIIAQFANPLGGEMITRRDMVDDPPDILVTNYSMLNVMMMRDLESQIFEKTRKWLEDKRNVFNLVVDELHLYRGTQGSEVAMIIRNLLLRLGLEPDSPQFRCIATSASLDDGVGGLDYLQEFFGVHKSSFDRTAGSPRSIAAKKKLPINDFLPPAEMNEEDYGRFLDDLRRKHEIPTAIAAVCIDARGHLVARPWIDIATDLFGGAGAQEALKTALDAISDSKDGESPVPIRSHMFFRNIRGMWACSNPKCDQVDRQEHVPIGKLYSSPRPTCTCGGRVLELLLCFVCGEISLGGFVVNSGELVFLQATPESDSQEGVPFPFRRKVEDFIWYSPYADKVATSNWSHGDVTFGFQRVDYDTFSGSIRTTVNRGTGATLRYTGNPPNGGSIPSLPDLCPCCDQRTGANNSPKLFFSPNVRSAIRAHTGGTDAGIQVYTSQLLRSLDVPNQSRKTIVFSDSRDSAAETSANLESGHFTDLLRQILIKRMRERVDVILALRTSNGLRTDEQRAAVNGVKERDSWVWMAYELIAQGRSSPDDLDRVGVFEEQEKANSQRIMWTDFVEDLRSSLLRLGVPPFGISQKYLRLLDDESDWFQAYEPLKNASGANYWKYIPGCQQELRDHRRHLVEKLADSIFAGSGRSLESTGLGWITLNSPVASPPQFDGLTTAQSIEVVDSVIRLLGISHRYDKIKRWVEASNRPASVSSYVDSSNLGAEIFSRSFFLQLVHIPALACKWTSEQFLQLH